MDVKHIRACCDHCGQKRNPDYMRGRRIFRDNEEAIGPGPVDEDLAIALGQANLDPKDPDFLNKFKEIRERVIKWRQASKEMEARKNE